MIAEKISDARKRLMEVRAASEADTVISPAPKRPSGTIKVTLEYQDTKRPISFED